MRLLLLVCLFASGLAAQAEISVSRGASNIASGSTEKVNYTGISPFNLTYTITNLGSSDLLLPSGVAISALDNCTVTELVAVASPVVAGSPESFTLQVAPVSAGEFSFILTVANNDADENPFSWTFDGHTSKPSSGGSGKGNSGDCSTGESTQRPALWLLVLIAAACAWLGRDLRRSLD